VRLGRGKFQVARPHAGEEGHALVLEAIALLAALARARQPQLGRQVEQQRAVGRQPRVRDVDELLDVGGVHAAAGALVGAAGIAEAVAQHPLPARQRRPDAPFHVRGARREHQQQLGGRRHGLPAARQRDGADLLGQGRAARFARGAHHPAAIGQGGGQRALQAGLARALDALERDEAAPAHGGGAAGIEAASAAAAAAAASSRLISCQASVSERMRSRSR
jgi:hypothetical protein